MTDRFLLPGDTDPLLVDMSFASAEGTSRCFPLSIKRTLLRSGVGGGVQEVDVDASTDKALFVMGEH